MKNLRHVAPLALIAALLFTLGCSDDSPTDPGSVPVISQLEVLGALRVSGSVGIVNLSVDYVDADADIDRFAFRVGDGPLAVNTLSGTTQPSGTVGVQQAVTLPAPGAEVVFSVFVMDRKGNRSNSLTGAFVAP